VSVATSWFGEGLCESCKSTRASNYEANLKVFEGVKQKGYTFSPPFHLKLSTPDSGSVNLQRPGQPETSVNLGVRFPGACVVCSTRSNLAGTRLVRRQTRGLFSSVNYSDATIKFPFEFSVPVCDKCRLKVEAQANPPWGDNLGFRGREIDLWEKKNFALLIDLGYSKFYGAPEFHWMEFTFRNRRYAKMFRRSNAVHVFESIMM
jgi:hypothetical protein